MLVAAGFLLGYIKIEGIDLSNFKLPWSIQGGGAKDNLVSVTKKLQFAFTDKYAGSALGSDTFYVYSAAGALLESLTTDSDGIKATANTYPSGTHLYVHYHQGNALMWYDLTVPKMTPADAESATYNNIGYEAFAIGTYTSDVLRTGATSLADDDIFNTTSGGGANSNPIFTYELTNSGADNTGLMNSFDAVYQQNLRVCIVITFSGTGYEHVVCGGFDSVFTLGTTTYAVKYYSPEKLTKWKVGANYQYGYEGTDIRTFSLDLTGIVEADDVTMQITAYAYADPDYAIGHGGSVGNSEYTIAEQTITIDDGP